MTLGSFVTEAATAVGGRGAGTVIMVLLPTIVTLDIILMVRSLILYLASPRVQIWLAVFRHSTLSCRTGVY